MPALSSADAAVRSAIDLFFALRNLYPASPIDCLGVSQLLAIDQLAQIFHLSTSSTPSTETNSSSPLRVPVSRPIPPLPVVPQPV